MRLFVCFKNGPYALYSTEDLFSELYRSGASYKDSSILKAEDYNYFVVKTTAGLFSINFCRENQETWFLAEIDPERIVTNRTKTLLIALYKIESKFNSYFNSLLLDATRAKF